MKFTYKYLFGVLWPKWVSYLRMHLDDLFTVFLFSGVQSLILYFQWMMSSNNNTTNFSITRVDVWEFKAVVERCARDNEVFGSGDAKVPLDWDDIFSSISYNNLISIANLEGHYKEFLTRYGVLLSELHKRVDALQISSSELFAAARRPTSSNN